MSAMMAALFTENTYPLEKRLSKVSRPKAVKAFVRILRAENNAGIKATIALASDKGEPIREMRYDFSKVSLEEAGLRAALESLKIARRNRVKHIVIFVDNERIVSIANGTEIPPAELVSLTLQVRALCHSFESAVIRYSAEGMAESLFHSHEPR